MKLKNNTVHLTGSDGAIDIKRNHHGIPEICAETLGDASLGLGWVHANDRQLQTLFTRIIVDGRAAELLKADESLVEIDQYMRRMNFLPDPLEQVAALEPDALEILDAYSKGFNLYFTRNKPVFEFRLLGYNPEPWKIQDSLKIGKVFGFLGLADTQGNMEKFIVELIQKGLDEEKLKTLFPYLTDAIDYDLVRQVQLEPPLTPEAVKWLDKLPRFNASNNWVVSGKHTKSGYPILCGDPHLEINRLPNTFQEIILRLPENTLMGVSVPGAPGVFIGRNSHIAWSPTYSFMDMLDYRIERCRNGQYYRKEGWYDFKVRKETIKVKKKPPVSIRIYENENGLLEGDPFKEGLYLALNWSGSRGCGAEIFNSFTRLMNAESTESAMALFKSLDAASFNWVIADTGGNIGYQMSGRHLNRPDGVSGLYPHPGWEKKYDADGFADPDRLPTVYNPVEGIIATANQDLNDLGQSNPINLAMGPYRADRIIQLLKSGEALDVAYMKNIHFDLYSLQAEALMKIIRPLLPDTENGNTLKTWNLCYEQDSKGAMLFESVYRSIIHVVFGDFGFGRDVVAHIFKETSLFNDYYVNLDRILESETSPWFGKQGRKAMFKKGIAEGLSTDAVPYGQTRKITMAHLLFGGQLPRFFGFDYGPIQLPGSRATIPQGQIFKSAGRLTTFSPAYRMITDMAENKIHTNLAGGPSDRRFSKYYTSDLKNWYEGNYKILASIHGGKKTRITD